MQSVKLLNWTTELKCQNNWTIECHYIELECQNNWTVQLNVVNYQVGLAFHRNITQLKNIRTTDTMIILHT